MDRVRTLNWIEALCRVGLGGLFMYSAGSKIADPGLFATTVMRYELLPEFAVGLFSLTLPMLELLTGLAFVLTKWTREAALLATGMLVMFLGALAIALARGLEIDCGCFGVSAGGGRRELLLAIGRDLALMVPAVWLMFRRNAWVGVRGVALALLAAAAYGGIRMAGTPAAKPPAAETVPVAKPKAHPARPTAPRKTVRARQAEKPVIEVDDDELSPENRKLADTIEELLDKEDLKALCALSSRVMASDSAEVRQAMVDALGWFGVKALPELTPYLADADEDVRESAMNEWSMAISEIEDEAEKLGIAELAMNVLTDEDGLEEISGEYIGVDEKLAVESLLRIIEAGGSAEGIAKAKETYEFVTGDAFVDRESAERWIAEEYEPPETPKKPEEGR